MTNEALKAKAYCRQIGIQESREYGFVINFKTHPHTFKNQMTKEDVIINYGYGLNVGNIYVDWDNNTGNPIPYNSYWEALCLGRK